MAEKKTEAGEGADGASVERVEAAPAAAAPATASGADEPQYEVLHGAASGVKDGKPWDYWRGSVVPASAFGAEIPRLVECGAIRPAE